MRALRSPNIPRRSAGSFWSALLVGAFFAVAGCQPADPFKVGDVLVDKSDGTVLGKVVEVGIHHFDSGVTDRSVLVELAKDRTHREWYSIQVLPAHFQVADHP